MKKLELGLSADGSISLADYRGRFSVRELTPEAQALRDAAAENDARVAWDLQLEKARDSIPKRFAWVPALSRAKDKPYVLPDLLTKRLPWLRAAHVALLRDALCTKANMVFCGPPGSGKTTLMTLLIRWYLRSAEFDHPRIATHRVALAEHERSHNTIDMRPRDPNTLREVRRARGLRFVTTHNLLTSNQRDIDGPTVELAQNASILFLDELGEELASAERGKHLSSSRAPAVTTVIKHRWNEGKRFFTATPYPFQQLESMYEGGAFRRIVGAESEACMIDLTDDNWAGEFIRERAKNKTSNVKR